MFVPFSFFESGFKLSVNFPSLAPAPISVPLQAFSGYLLPGSQEPVCCNASPAIPQPSCSSGNWCQYRCPLRSAPARCSPRKGVMNAPHHRSRCHVFVPHYEVRHFRTSHTPRRRWLSECGTGTSNINYEKCKSQGSTPRRLTGRPCMFNKLHVIPVYSDIQEGLHHRMQQIGN